MFFLALFVLVLLIVVMLVKRNTLLQQYAVVKFNIDSRLSRSPPYKDLETNYPEI